MEDGIKTRLSGRRSDTIPAHRQWGSTMRSYSSMRAGWFAGPALLAVVSILLAGCNVARTHAGSKATGSAIEFTSVPVAGADNPEQLNAIKGRVIGARPGQQIVLYAGQTTWWVQPSADHPFTKIQADGKWSNSTHPGMQYAALLVGPDFHPQPTTDVLPTGGVIAAAVSKGEQPLWQRWWFPIACVIAGALVIFGIHRLWLHQTIRKLNLRFEERLGERMRVAQELHDTLLQGLLSVSMQLHVAADQLPPDSPARPGLDRVLQLMGQVIEEGRNTLRGLRSSTEMAHDLESSFSRIPQELSSQEGTEFRIIVQGPTLRLQPGIRDDVYRIGREAVLNAFRHSGARNIEVEVKYAPDQLKVLVRDNGCGIDPHVVEHGRDGHWGLCGMRERAERIGAKLRLWSRSGEGTEVELRIPANIAFESYRSRPTSNWVARLWRGDSAKTGHEAGKRVA